jgi:1-acyl-sn-glycerol-3-phosphate acyltransferase
MQKPKPLGKGLGADYDTTWARKPIPRVVRAMLINGITRPVINMIATPTVLGRERLDKLDGPAVFVANHSSHLDTSLMMTAIPARFRRKMAVAARHEYFFDKWWKATVWSLWMNVIPIERSKASRRSIELAQSVIAQGWNLALYPEESRGPDDYLLPFKPGAAYLAIKAGVPIVPMHFTGTRRVFSPYTHRFRPGRTRVVIGEPLWPREDERPQRFNERVEAAVAQAADESRTDWWSSRIRAAKGTTPSLRAPDGETGWRRTWSSTAPRYAQPQRQWP